MARAAKRAVCLATFLVPKREVAWISQDVDMRHAFLRLEESGYTALPILDRDGCYVGTISEGDLLRKLMYRPPVQGNVGIENTSIAEIPLRSRILAVDIDAKLPDLLQRLIDQSFVPVKDSRGIFIGIVRRREVLQHYARRSRGWPPAAGRP